MEASVNVTFVTFISASLQTLPWLIERKVIVYVWHSVTADHSQIEE